MSHITIKIKTNNAAFEDFDHEVSRILHKLADRVVDDGAKDQEFTIYDLNGNNVGSFRHFKR